MAIQIRSWETLFAEYMRLDVAHGAAQRATLRTYASQLRRYLTWCGECGIHPAHATEEDLKAYRAQLAARYARATVATRLAVVRRFYAMMQARGYRADNPAEGLRPPPERTAREMRVRFLPLGGLSKLLDAPSGGVRAVRDRAILALMGIHGLRVSEVAALDVADLDLEGGTLTIRGKGEKQRMVYLVDITRERLQAWLLVREAQENEPALFVAQDRGRRFLGRRLSARAIEYLTDRYLEELGLKRPGVSCHSLRHSAATWARAAGASLDGLADMLGHSNVETTRIYARIVRRLEENPARYLEAILGGDVSENGDYTKYRGT